MINTSIKLFLWGLLLWPMFINIVGVISPLRAIHVLHDGSRSEEFIHNVLIGISSFMEILMLFLGGIILLGVFDSTSASEEHPSSAK